MPKSALRILIAFLLLGQVYRERPPRPCRSTQIGRKLDVRIEFTTSAPS